ncbi:unnamed protein product, partial [Symbiodinium microadriaticum]
FRVTLLTFTDLDLDNDEVAYHVFLATDETGSNRFRISNGTGIPQGSNEFDVEPDTTVDPTLVEGVASRRDASTDSLRLIPETQLVEENTPAALAISDTFVQAQQVSFTDLDLDVNQFGGNLTWQQPSLDTGLITHYMVYFGLDAAGLDNRYLFTYVPQPFSEIAIPAETSLYHPSYFGADNTSMLFAACLQRLNYLLVYARSTLAEQTTPAYVGIIDSDMPVKDVFWVGEDLDINDLQGTLQWTPPENISGEVITQPDFNF